MHARVNDDVECVQAVYGVKVKTEGIARGVSSERLAIECQVQIPKRVL